MRSGPLRNTLILPHGFAGQVRQGGPQIALAWHAGRHRGCGAPRRWRRRVCGSVSDGGEGQNRTDDTQIFSLVLYQLSYLATDVGQLKKDEYTMRVRR
jgi:hypothetical protein